MEFGQTPKMLFTNPHPQRFSSSSSSSSNQTAASSGTADALVLHAPDIRQDMTNGLGESDEHNYQVPLDLTLPMPQTHIGVCSNSILENCAHIYARVIHLKKSLACQSRRQGPLYSLEIGQLALRMLCSILGSF